MAIAVAQTLTNSASYTVATGTTVAVTITPAAGSTLVVWVTGGDSNTSITVADSRNAGNYTAGPVNDDTGDSQALQRFYKQNVAAGSTTITATWGAAVQFRAIAVAEVTGSNQGAADGSSGNIQGAPGTGTDALTTSNMTNATQPALIVALCMDVASTSIPAAGTGFTSNGSDATAAWRIESKRITTTGSTQAATFTATTGADTHITAGFIFDEGAGAALASVPPLNEASSRRPSPRPIPTGGDVAPPLVTRGAGIDTSPPVRRPSPRPIPSGGEGIEPSANHAAGIDSSPPAWRSPPRPQPATGETTRMLVVVAPGPWADVSPPQRRPQLAPIPSGGDPFEPLVVRGAGIDSSPPQNRRQATPQPFGGDVARAATAAPPAAFLGSVTDVAWRRAPRPPPFGTDVATPLVIFGAGIDTTPPVRRPSRPPPPSGAEAFPRPGQVLIAVDVAMSARRPDRAPALTMVMPFGALPPQTVIIARVPAPPTSAIGLTYTDVVGLTAPTRAQ